MDPEEDEVVSSGEEEEEVEVGALRFYALQVREGRHLPFPPCYFFSLPETILKFRYLSYIVHPALPKGPEGDTIIEQPLPFSPSYCSLGRSLFLIGGMRPHWSSCMKYHERRLLWSLDCDQHPTLPGSVSQSTSFHWTWRICGHMKQERLKALGVPYDGLLFIFGGTPLAKSWVEIYDPELAQFVESKDVPPHISQIRPTSYFLWDKNHEKKQLIVLLDSLSSRLWSYDVEGDEWTLFGSDFPVVQPEFASCRRAILPLSPSNILIIDHADIWLVYNLDSMKVTGKVKVQGLTEDRAVTHAFFRHICPDGSWLLFIFMEGYAVSETSKIRGGVPYAKVRLQPEGTNFIATLESHGLIDAGDHTQLMIFAVERTTRTGKEAREKKDNDDGDAAASIRLPMDDHRIGLASPAMIQHNDEDSNNPGTHSETPVGSSNSSDGLSAGQPWSSLCHDKCYEQLVRETVLLREQLMEELTVLRQVVANMRCCRSRCKCRCRCVGRRAASPQGLHPD